MRSAPLFLCHCETNSSNICDNCFRICLTCAIATIVLFTASAGFHHDYNIYSALFCARLRYQDSTEIHCTKTTASIRTPAIGRSFSLVLFASLRILDHTTSEYILSYIDSLVFYILSRLSFSLLSLFFFLSSLLLSSSLAKGSSQHADSFCPLHDRPVESVGLKDITVSYKDAYFYEDLSLYKIIAEV